MSGKKYITKKHVRLGPQETSFNLLYHTTHILPLEAINKVFDRKCWAHRRLLGNAGMFLHVSVNPFSLRILSHRTTIFLIQVNTYRMGTEIPIKHTMVSVQETFSPYNCESF